MARSERIGLSGEGCVSSRSVFVPGLFRPDHGCGLWEAGHPEVSSVTRGPCGDTAVGRCLCRKESETFERKGGICSHEESRGAEPGPRSCWASPSHLWMTHWRAPGMRVVGTKPHFSGTCGLRAPWHVGWPCLRLVLMPRVLSSVPCRDPPLPA